MYEEFFGLRALPFNLTPDPAFLFLPSKHREALAGLTYAVLARKGFVVLTGDAGTGKTTLLTSSLAHLPEGKIYSSVILNPTLTPAEFLELVLLDFGMVDIPASKAQRIWKLQEFLLVAHREGKIAILVIDEAHKLSPELLEEVRLLGNFEYGPEKLIQVLLLGQCELDDMLDRQDLRQFKQRIALRLYIDPLSTVEVADYIRFRWEKAGGVTEVPLTPEAIASVANLSRGIPRLVNSICDTALLTAYSEGLHTVTEECVRGAAASLALLEIPKIVMPATITAAPQEHHRPLKPMPVEKSAPAELSVETQNHRSFPTFAGYGAPRANSSLLKRLAGKFGF